MADSKSDCKTAPDAAVSGFATITAVLGRTQLPPGLLPVRTVSPARACLVKHNYYPRFQLPEYKLDVDTADCTLFTVIHQELPALDFNLATTAHELMEQSLQAISELTIWLKAREVVGYGTTFLRQVGWLDAKYFFFPTPDDHLVSWHNPLFESGMPLSIAGNVFDKMIGNMILQPAPASSPVPNISRRAMAALDLINLGFYTESFVSVFALLDDLTQEVMRSGLSQRSFSKKEQDQFLRAIKESRLEHYVTLIPKACGWISLNEANEPLFKRLMKANKVRNGIMHESVRLARHEAIDSSNALLDTIDWLRTNPFAYVIPHLPRLRVAEGQFRRSPKHPPEQPKTAVPPTELRDSKPDTTNRPDA